MSIYDRFLINQILPRKGKIEELLLSKDVGTKIELNQKDFKEADIVQNENGQIEFKNKEKSTEKNLDVEFSNSEINFIKEQLKKLSDSGEMQIQYIDLYEAFNKV